MGALKIFNGTAWDTIVSTGAIIASVAPSPPAVGQLWYDTTNQILKIWDGTSWDSATFSANISQTTLTGGGIRNYVTSASPGISWSLPFTIRAATQLTNEFTTVTMPINGVTITGYGGASGQTVAGGRLPLANGTTLYYDVPSGGSATTDNSRFKIAAPGYTTPRSWTPIASRDDSATATIVTWGDGRVGWDGDAGGVVSSTGAWSASNPPNGTTGTQFTIVRAGLYLLEADAGGYVGAGGVNTTFTHFIDGVQGGTRGFFFNTASEHCVPVRAAWVQSLTVGIHYWWVKFTHSSDTNDNGTLNWTRV